MADYDSNRDHRAPDPGTSGAVQRAAGKRTLTEQRYGVVQHNGGAAGADPDAVHRAADHGISGAGERLPFMDQIVRSFGKHDVSAVQAHTDGAAADASHAMGATAYAKGDHVAFGQSPDLHTAAHEAAHVVQQRAGVHLKGGVGEAGDAYEQHADAVADKVVQGESAESLLDTMAGPAGGGGAVQTQAAVQKLGVPLDEELPADQSAPVHGETKGEQRRWSVDQYVEMWEKEQGRKIKPQEREAIDYGCIGITANNLNGVPSNPLDSAEKVYGDFERAHEYMTTRNKMLDWMASVPFIGAMVPKARYVMFGKLFWSNQSEDWNDRLKPNKKAFKPDKKTGEVDMTDYKYHAQSKWDVDEDGNRVASGYVNFDYGFWDEASQCFWHANHYMDYSKPDDPMIVLQSTRAKFTAGYRDFDRLVFGVAKAENYNPALAAITTASAGSSSRAGQ